MFTSISRLTSSSMHQGQVAPQTFIPPNSIPSTSSTNEVGMDDSEQYLDINFLNINSFTVSNVFKKTFRNINFDTYGLSEISISTTSPKSPLQELRTLETLPSIKQKNYNFWSWPIKKTLIIVIIACTIVSQLVTWLSFLIRKSTNYNTLNQEGLIIDSITSWLCTTIIGSVSFAIYNNKTNKYIKDLLYSEKHKVLTENASLMSQEKLSTSKEFAKQKSILLSYLFHEILNPLQGSLFCLNIINTITNLTEEQQEAIKTFNICIKRIECVMSKLKELQKLQSTEDHQKPNEKTIFTLKNLINIVCEPIKNKVQDKHLQLICQSNVGFDSKFNGHFEKLVETLTILLSNAIKFTEQGFIRVMIRKEREMQNNIIQLHFAIQDSGIGINADKLQQLFKPYCQTEHNEELFPRGTGLGLSIAHELIMQINSADQLEKLFGVFSKVGFGSIFWFRVYLEKIMLPKNDHVSTPTLNLSHQNLSIEQPVIYNLNVLVVDDSTINQTIMNKILTSQLGCKVTTANNGQEAIDLVCTKQPILPYDVIFMDIHMPIMDGIKATNILRTKLQIKCPIIACTANGTQDDITEYLAAGMNECVIKPIDVQKLHVALKHFFNCPKEDSTSSLDSLSQERTLINKNKHFHNSEDSNSIDDICPRRVIRSNSKLLFKFNFGSYEHLEPPQHTPTKPIYENESENILKETLPEQQIKYHNSPRT